jgi:hypothetical protein
LSLNQLPIASRIRRRVTSGMQKPPLNKTASGLTMGGFDGTSPTIDIDDAAFRRNEARCFVIAGSVA